MNEKSENGDTVLTEEDLLLIRKWLKENGDSFPLEIRTVVELMLDLCCNAQGLLKSNKKLVALLRQYMGFIPTKERDSKDEKNIEPVWSEKTQSKLHHEMKKATEKWKEYKKHHPKKVKNKSSDKFQKNQNPKNESTEISALPSETVFNSPAVQINEAKKECLVNPDDLPEGLVSPSSSYQERSRFDLSLCLTKINYRVETIRDPITGFSKTAKVEDGPARFRVTWEALAQIVLLVAGMGIPMVRLASCLQTASSYFSPSRVYRLCLYVAQALSAVYLEIFRQLATCEILSGDDTNSSVLGMRQDDEPLSPEAQEEKERALVSSKEEKNPQKCDFILEVDEIIGGQRPTKDGKRLKKSIFTTVMIGERRTLGPKGTLIFYHSERKSFGDLLGRVLSLRSALEDKNEKKRPITIQSDLSSSNIPTPYPSELDLQFMGCAAHARRPFWRFRSDVDPKVGYYCYTMLLLFDKIFDSDRAARENGNLQNILAARKMEQPPLWEEIKAHCVSMQSEFAPNSDLGKAAGYILNNFGKLTHYLGDPRLRPDNNLAERLLRYEKIMQDNSKFRVTKKGRLVYDILRTILASCNAAGAEPLPYLVHVLRNQVDARQSPARYTPHAYVSTKK